MSQKDKTTSEFSNLNASQSESQENRERQDESFESLASRLEAKYNLKQEQREQTTTELRMGLKQEIDDTSFIDLQEFTKSRSRNIETKYGLKPMSDLISPKTEEEKTKEIDDYLKKNSILNNASYKAHHLNASLNQELEKAKQTEEEYPAIYHWLESVPHFRPEINIGEKWANQITEQIRTETELKSASRRRGSHIYQSWKKGRMGVDKYLILFGVFGAIVMPVYIYYHNKKFKEALMAERGIKPGEEVDVENGQWDIDDFSNHRRFYEDKDEKKKAIKKLAVQQQIKRLEQELYPEGRSSPPPRRRRGADFE